jgi:uncharacterized protein (DUF1501 family)
MNLSRRHFLRTAGYGFGGTALLSAINQFAVSTALAKTRQDYKALVCIFLQGGNDANNMVISLDNYATYAAIRHPNSTQNLTIAQNTLLPIATSIGNYGFHPAMPDIQRLYNQGSLAVVCNVGPLVQPMTKNDYVNNLKPKPTQLFSHSDQVTHWQNARADTQVRTGWGGRIADIYGNIATLPMVTSISGNVLFLQGASTSSLVISPAPTTLPNVLVLNGFGTAADEQARKATFDYFRTIDRSPSLVDAAASVTDQSRQIAGIFNYDPTLQTVFPNTTLGNQLKQVAKVMSLNQNNGIIGRQIFFCDYGGFDTHQNELNTQNTLLTQVNAAMAAFYNATVELGISAQVTTFTMSDFGRTFQPSGTGGSIGSDHGWGNHHLIMGDSIAAADFYGVPGANGTPFPTMQLGGPDDADSGSGARGRWLPATSVEQYGATLASWYGVADTDMPTAFPLIGNFTPNTAPYLGFLH